MLLTALRLAGLSSSVLSCSLAFAASGKLPVEVDYNFHIKPILSDRCYQCHGPDANARQADLRLDRHDARLGETVTEVAIIALVRVARSNDGHFGGGLFQAGIVTIES